LCHISEIERDVKMALHLNDGSLGNGKVSDEFHLAIPPKAFRDVSHHRDGRPLDLIPQAKILSKGP
jgi:hypothetical protein